MIDEVVVKQKDVIRIYKLMAKIHEFIHQPMNYKDVEVFAEKNYPEIKAAYYDILWGWLPAEIRKEIEES